MYVQELVMTATPEAIPVLLKRTEAELLPHLAAQPGVLSACLIAHIDRQDTTILFIHWQDQDAMLAAREAGLLTGPVLGILHVPGLHVMESHYQRQPTVAV